MNRLAALLAALALGLAAPAPAIAQLGPTNVPEQLTAPDPSETQGEPIEEDTGLTTRQLVLIFGGAIAVLAVIAWFIMRDAKGVAPVAQGGRAPQTPAAAKKSAREREREQARKRNKAKAARNQRKRNRPR